MKTSEATRALEAANKFGRDASALESKAASYGADAANLQAKISRAEAAERERLARQQALAQRAAEQERRKFAQQISFTQQRVSMTETALHHLKAPKVEKLRILMLGASSQGDLRVGREHTRIRRAVEVAVHRDQVEIDVRLSATAQDLLEGIAKFRPHVVHFSGHGDDQLIVFEDDIDDLHEGVIITASAFAAACAATDDPPTLVVLNACHSKGTAEALVNRCAPLAVGMNGSIDDADALQYATALYSSIANGHSVGSAHAAGKAAIELSGGEHDLPYLALTPGITASVVKLVQEP
ncbi:CHAT domain-containing protein [Amycolatopsis sp. NPDC051106]|uniref:CHAT domain-containing protein n=1 Tax=unclassified Amycolatopsis TaxID=2618356 RepID=UPI003423B673